MEKTELSSFYHTYIACLNARDLSKLERFVCDDVSHNGRAFGLPGYRQMLEKDFSDIPDLYFNIGILVSDPPHIACRLEFNCAPKSIFLGLPVNGRKITFAENVFYAFKEGKIAQVWSVIDKAAIEAQLV